MNTTELLQKARTAARGFERVSLRSTRLVEVLRRNGLARRAYLALMATSFSRESRSVLTGIAKHRSAAASGLGEDYYEVRRSLHRIEKGLISSPRRPVFAADYAPELVDALATAPEDWRKTDPELFEWALSVLTAYFDAIDIGVDARLAEAERRFHAMSEGYLEADRLRAPFPAGERAPVTVTPDELEALFERRRSVRWFDQRPVPRELLDRALQMASQAPSACNRQPYRFLIADTPADAQALGSLPMGTAGFSHQFPCCIALVGQMSAFGDIRDRHVPYIDGGLVAMSFVLALETLGLSSCLINWPDVAVRDRRARAHLGIGVDEQIIVLIAVGYAAEDGGVPRSVKKDLSLIREFRTPPS